METNIEDIITHPTWTDAQESLITGPYDYLAQTKGKHLRTQLIELFNTVLCIPKAKLDQISKIIEMLHTASLLIDDIEDDSTLRRGKPTAHLIYGSPYVINSSNYVYFLALQDVLALDDPHCVTAFNEELLNLHRGQSMDLYWRENLVVPSEEEYINMVMNKTGGLFRLAVRLMERFSNSDIPSLVPLANILGIIYQIKDDYLNLKNETLQENKGFCEDISEGKFSFPMIHSLRTSPHDRTLMGILKQKTQDVEIKKFALHFLERTNSFQYTLDSLASVKGKAQDCVKSLQLDCNDEHMVRNFDLFNVMIEKLSNV